MLPTEAGTTLQARPGSEFGRSYVSRVHRQRRRLWTHVYSCSSESVALPQSLSLDGRQERLDAFFPKRKIAQTVSSSHPPSILRLRQVGQPRVNIRPNTFSVQQLGALWTHLHRNPAIIFSFVPPYS